MHNVCNVSKRHRKMLLVSRATYHRVQPPSVASIVLTNDFLKNLPAASISASSKKTPILYKNQLKVKGFIKEPGKFKLNLEKPHILYEIYRLDPL